jgi:AmmeMemoRadiSam system protein A
MPFLSEAEQRSALELARRTVIDTVLQRKLLDDIPKHGKFAEHCGVFVTLRIAGRLQGCIGVVEAREPLGEAIVRCAASAALEDPRFAPLRTEQLAALRIELSLLSPLAPIHPESIEIGRHGLFLSLCRQRGLLLPQVAVAHHLTREQFLDETCRKAGLRPGDWRDPEATLLGFTCEVYSDDPPPG